MPIRLVRDITLEKIHSSGGNKWISFPVCIRLSLRPSHLLIAFFEFLGQYFPWFDINLRPSPKGPVWEDYIQRAIISTITKQRGRGRGLGTTEVSRYDDWPVDTVKHELQIRHFTRVLAQQL
uniref:Uncharacterized protein n=1 Tax=Opuntia streptacantha TaxID=393608 RepID=A0A7C9D6R5_OPUST